jgi:hypothetical protein
LFNRWKFGKKRFISTCLYIAMPSGSPAVRLEYLIVVYLRPMRTKARELPLIDFLPKFGWSRKGECVDVP